MPTGGGRVVRYYADVHKTRRRGEGYRMTYSTDGITFKYVDSFSEFPAGPGDQLFVDTIPPSHTDGVMYLLRRGVEVYYLRRLTLIKKIREEFKLPKTARGDVRALMRIGDRWFRKVTEDFLVLRRMILAYRSLLKTHQQLINKYKALSEVERNILRPAINSLEEQMDEMARQITVEAGRRYPAYNRLVDELGIGGRIDAMEAMAELVVYLEPSKGWRKTRNLVGLFKPIHGRKKIYSGCLRKALQRLTASANNTSPSRLTARMEKEVLLRVWMIYRMEALGRLAMPAQG
jgi:hypothetical protein